ncbi:major facilitator superfamily domain-containing protein 12-like [Orbicella faveolata]|uniref:major facilitator superfamily domain-containing protein 12-like n=2 Tax=Orbicella faveolata TaxID=48498 RepID=UPI0009E414FE|nr:major facilitator superfamily domain-containing protein 12-like [Orbicella faveolata]
MVWICGRNKPKEQLVHKEERTSVKQKICYGVGHVFNDLCIQAWFTYLIIFFNKIVKISATGTGYIFLSSQIADAISTPFIGYGCDKSLSKKISKKYGNRKIWHLFGSVGIALIWPFVFSPCLVCKEDSPDWVPVAYYGVFAALFSVCWPMVEISHLSLMPHVAKRSKDAVELSAIRSALKLGCGVFVYVVTWILLGQNSEETVDESAQKQFTYQSIIVMLTGSFFALIFHWGVDEADHSPEQEKEKPSKALLPASAPECKDLEKQALEIELQRQENQEQQNDSKMTWKQWFKNPDFYKIVLIYMTTQNVVNLNQSYFPMYLTDTLHFEKEAIAYFPLMILISGILTSTIIKRLNRYFSNRVLFCAGAVIVIGCATWFYFTPQSQRDMIYAPTIIMGAGNSMMLVTSLAMVAEIIGDDKKSSGFVYGVCALMDKTSLGFIVLGLQENYPETKGPCGEPCAQYLRGAFSVFPGIEALVAFLIVALLYRPSSNKNMKRRMTISGKEEVYIDDIDFKVLPYLKSTEV